MRVAYLAVLLLAGACTAEQPAANDTVEDQAEKVAPQAPAAAPAASDSPVRAKAGETGAAKSAAPSIPILSWTGRFAATPELCRGGVWNIGRERIVTEGETSCTVEDVNWVSGAVRLTLACQAEGMRTDETWTLTPGAGDALAVEREIGTETIRVQLRRCA